MSDQPSFPHPNPLDFRSEPRRLVRLFQPEHRSMRAIAMVVKGLGHTLVEGDTSADVVVAACPEDELSAAPELAEAWADEVLAARVAAEARRVVVVSSLRAVGPLGPGEEFVFEGCPCRPADALGESLLKAEDRLLARRDAEGFALIILRAPALFDDEVGPELAALLTAIDRDPGAVAGRAHDHVYPFLHREDLGFAVAAALNRGDWIYHLGANHCPTVADVVIPLGQRFLGYGQADWPAVPAGPTPKRVHWRYPHHRAERELGFVVRRPLPEAAESLVFRVFAAPVCPTFEGRRRPFRWNGRLGRLDPADLSQDLSSGAVTLRDPHGDGVVQRLTPEAIAPSATRGGPRARPLRRLLEDAVDQGFSDFWIARVLEFACREGLVEGPTVAPNPREHP